MSYGLKTRPKQHFMTITFPMAHHYCIVDTAVHGQEIFKTMIHFPNHGQQIVVVTGDKTDRYGRILGTVWLEDQDVNAMQVANGMA